MRVLFTIFAEDTNLIPKGSFSGLLKSQRGHPELLHHQEPICSQGLHNGGKDKAFHVERLEAICEAMLLGSRGFDANFSLALRERWHSTSLAKSASERVRRSTL